MFILSNQFKQLSNIHLPPFEEKLQASKKTVFYI